ncbi:uncharacterized protein LOC125889197 isoform X1 [Epinephelus fuscoguttatus]|uniref:uncharacterized protein LOC125889197 isoform X1 n=1 Tax=Epinephelus fuscoguttatus TaxID=293821 RepID=UPI0020D1907E|nr:uncharacterized protein LOC125889197 isoform X1 [Epinephelus fuscoguttatus]
MFVQVYLRCTCEECITMPTEEQNVCCKELNAVQNRCGELPEEPRCMTLHPGLEPVCLNPYSLQNALNVYQADHGPLDVKERAAAVLDTWPIEVLCPGAGDTWAKIAVWSYPPVLCAAVMKSTLMKMGNTQVSNHQYKYKTIINK